MTKARESITFNISQLWVIDVRLNFLMNRLQEHIAMLLDGCVFGISDSQNA